MHTLLFITYAAALSFIITRSAFLSGSGIPKKTLVILFLLYALAGCAHLCIAWNYFPGHGDVWQMFRFSVSLKQDLLHDYPSFKKEFFPDAFSVDLAGTHAGWSYYEQQWLTALHIVFDFFSFDSIYINTLLFCFLTMFGKVALYRMLGERYPASGPAALLLVFFIPGVVFWTAVIHKEGLLYCCLGVLLYCLQKIFTRQATFRRWAFTLSVLLIIFITRKAVFVTLLPAIAIWWICAKTPVRKAYVVSAVLAAGALSLFVLGCINPSWSILHQLSIRQQDFMGLNGGSRIFLAPLSGSGMSFLNVLPYAIRNGIFMPLPGTGGNRLYLLFFAETVLLWGVVTWSVIKKRLTIDGFTLGFLVFAISGMLVIGYTVPFAGAIVRYRSILYPFLLVMAGVNPGRRF